VPPSRPSMTSDVLVCLERVGKTFRMGEVEVEALRDVTLEVVRGELLAVVGPSGSGKTTLLNLLGGLDRPTVGTVRFQGRDLSALGPGELAAHRRRSLGFVFQFFNLIPTLTARENVLVAAEISDDPLDAAAVLAQVGLEDRMDHFPAQLSGGEQQRVAIARALAKNPQLLLCDEPIGALDFATGKAVLRLLWEVRRTMGRTVVIITHNLAISRMADRLVRLRSGEVVEVAAVPEPASPEDLSW
jgi:putative ABC transport system ATP-binding protein